MEQMELFTNRAPHQITLKLEFQGKTGVHSTAFPVLIHFILGGPLLLPSLRFYSTVHYKIQRAYTTHDRNTNLEITTNKVHIPSTLRRCPLYHSKFYTKIVEGRSPWKVTQTQAGGAKDNCSNLFVTFASTCLFAVEFLSDRFLICPSRPDFPHG